MLLLRPCGLMDKALPSGGRDCGFESRLGLLDTLFSGPGPLAVVCGLRCNGAKVLAAPANAAGGWGGKGGDARIELATSCTLSKNHTTRPITHIRTNSVGNESNNAFFGVATVCIPARAGARCNKINATTAPAPPKKKRECTACGDRTRDQSIKSRTLYLTELRRPVVVVCARRFLHILSRERLTRREIPDFSAG
jgi:hypothetical protein